MALHVRAAAKRDARLLRAQGWLTAALMRTEKLPEFDEFVTGRRDRRREVRQWVAAWNKVAPALAANRGRRAA